MFAAYCTVCKICIGWGDNDASLKTTRHSSGEFEKVELLDSEGNNVLDAHENPVMVMREITHECSTFELDSELPADISSDNMKAYIEENFFPAWPVGD